MQPLNDRVLIKRDDQQDKTEGGLYLPSTSQEKPNSGVVIKAGHGRRAPKTGKLIPMTVKEGDKVLFSKYGGQEIELYGETYLVLREDEIFAVVGSINDIS